MQDFCPTTRHAHLSTLDRQSRPTRRQGGRAFVGCALSGATHFTMSRVPSGSFVARLRSAHRRMVRVMAAALAVVVVAGAAYADAPPPSWQAYQRDFHFQQLDSSDGLVQSSVSLIFQDQQGFMWLVTQGGLFRYDGYSLRRYTHD